MSAKQNYEDFADEMGGEDLQSRDKQNALKSFEGTVFLPPGVMNLESELLVSRLRGRKVNLLADVFSSLIIFFNEVISETGVSRTAFLHILQQYYKCVKAIAVTSTLAMAAT